MTTQIVGKVNEAATSLCPKCQPVAKTGILSCCARGGSWFHMCGDPGDPNVDHTWNEGIEACKRKLRESQMHTCIDKHNS